MWYVRFQGVVHEVNKDCESRAIQTALEQSHSDTVELSVDACPQIVRLVIQYLRCDDVIEKTAWSTATNRSEWVQLFAMAMILDIPSLGRFIAGRIINFPREDKVPFVAHPDMGFAKSRFADAIKSVTNKQ